MAQIDGDNNCDTIRTERPAGSQQRTGYAAALKPLEARLSEIERSALTEKNLWREWRPLKNAIFWLKQAAGFAQQNNGGQP